MSHKRRGCVHHQRNLLKFKAFKDIKPKNDKNLLYRRWQSVLKAFSPTAHTIPDTNDYRFLVPYFVHNRPIPVAPPEIEVGSIEESTTPINPTSSTPILYTVEPYNPIPDMFIPHKYCNIIPPDPIYAKNGTFIIPGTREWFTYMSELGKKLARDRRRQEIQIDHCQQQDNIERDAIAKARKEEAALLGTSVKRLDTRCVAIDRLTSTADIFHENMVKFTEKKAINADNIKCQKKLRNEMNKFLDSFKRSIRQAAPRDDPNTSDDTKDLELRLNKRDVTILISLHIIARSNPNGSVLLQYLLIIPWKRDL
ncbi:hypothetical protein RhiirA4_502062 [Rhizophagus irregularis]|uniref:Uncharacterized protein n=1 Tax=Rhizophagus irregularis TaxID=588596 RepID=A0A2I1H738_9GLOM|nr:hypothetical protein RhiirA4_502062 [Rhizophagus irregularis]